MAKVQKSAPSTKLTFIQCDLTSLASVQAAAREFRSKSNRLDVLMCNAGIMATPASMSQDGYEIQFATNHLGHALLIKLLLPLLLDTAKQVNSDVRVVNLASVAYRQAPSRGIEFDNLKKAGASYGRFFTPNKWACYGQSKLANLLYATKLAEHYPSITSVAVHPGFIKTDLHSNENFMDRQVVNMIADKWLSVEAGAYNQTWAATTQKKNLENGAYYEPVAKKTTPNTMLGKDARLAMALWDWTEKELKSWE